MLERPHLLRALGTALRSGHVLVNAPAGYGKSMLLRRFASQRPNSYYISLTSGDADLATLSARIHALQAPVNATFLLDDIHHLDGAVVTLRWLSEQLHREDEDAPRWVLVGRYIPLSNIGDLAAAGRLTTLSAGDLAFTPQEASALGVDESWHGRVAGWPLALGLLQRLADAAPVSDPASAQTLFFDYLAATFFERLPDALRTFMHITAVPLRFNLALATHLYRTQHPRLDAAGLFSLVQQRQLFLEPDKLDGWFRYHEMIRTFLLQNQTAARAVHEATVQWLLEQDGLEPAIEQALAGELWDRADDLIEAARPTVLDDEGRLYTFERWLNALPSLHFPRHVESLCDLAVSLHNVGERQRAWRYLERIGADVAALTQDAQAQLKLSQAYCLFNEERFAESIAALEILDALVTPTNELHLESLRLRGRNLLGFGKVREAERVYRLLMQRATALGNDRWRMFAALTLVSYVLAPRGAFEEAAALLDDVAEWFARVPYLEGAYLTARCALATEQGEWGALEAALVRMAEILADGDEIGPENAAIHRYYRAVLAIAQGDYGAAQHLLDETAALWSADELNRLAQLTMRTWLARRRGDPTPPPDSNEALSSGASWPQLRTELALERLLAAGFTDTVVVPNLHLLSAERLRPRLLRFSAWLTVTCWHLHDAAWRRHAQRTLHALRRPGFSALLTQRDPDLGAHFWSVLAVEALAPEQATAALREIGQIAPLTVMLQATETRVRRCAATVLGALGVDGALAELAGALEKETEPSVRAALEQAISQLMQFPPPILEVQLLGEFVVRRNDAMFPEEVWHRPIVRKLFQYYCLHRRERLSKERILEDLWPDETPRKATATFHTVHSRLRNVLEPYLRARSPSRYFTVEGDVYCFDPYDRVRVDAEHFMQRVRQALATARQEGLPPMPDDLIALLVEWQPLLPALPYEEWLIQPRETVHQLYIEGCLYLAHASLARGLLDEVILWAERALARAPWLEEGYQALMRAHARLDQRSLALKRYADVVAALERELGAPPSPLTEWLAERLRRGEEI
ncbi:MAG: BTAD domain-containing putative transcriptional regulator [Caldilinea sp.]